MRGVDDRPYLPMLYEEIEECRACPLCETRTQVVIDRGDPYAKILLLGEAPGEREDMTGVPFVGRAGQLLDEMLAEAEIDSYYVCNTIKCRPPENRPPHAAELEACSGFLQAQLRVVDPAVVVALGRTALRALGLEDQLPAVGWRGKVVGSTMVTFHPAYVLRSPGSRNYVIGDLIRARKFTEVGSWY
jgi:uracil-DNA glycosylase family 4